MNQTGKKPWLTSFDSLFHKSSNKCSLGLCLTGLAWVSKLVLTPSAPVPCQVFSSPGITDMLLYSLRCSSRWRWASGLPRWAPWCPCPAAPTGSISRGSTAPGSSAACKVSVGPRARPVRLAALCRGRSDRLAVPLRARAPIEAALQGTCLITVSWGNCLKCRFLGPQLQRFSLLRQRKWLSKHLHRVWAGRVQSTLRETVRRTWCPQHQHHLGTGYKANVRAPSRIPRVPGSGTLGSGPAVCVVIKPSRWFSWSPKLRNHVLLETDVLGWGPGFWFCGDSKQTLGGLPSRKVGSETGYRIAPIWWGQQEQ